jgi:hypothetical protein
MMYFWLMVSKVSVHSQLALLVLVVVRQKSMTERDGGVHCCSLDDNQEKEKKTHRGI